MAHTFDALEYFEKLKAAGVPEAQAKVQADALRIQNETQARAFKTFTDEQEEKARRELATKGDLRETELRLQKEIRDTELRLLKWQWGIALALAAIMAKGFGWLGF